MFFKLHNEKRIGYKIISDAELDRTDGNITHIGLFGDVLEFLPNRDKDADAMVVYENNVEFLTAHFDRIQNPDGTYRSPKIKTGGKNVVSVVSFIKDTAKSMSNDLKWYLFWFGLESEQLVFMFFNNKSATFNDICSLGIDLNELPYSKTKTGKILYETDTAFSKILSYLEEIVNKSGKNFAAELEVAAQTNEKTSKKYKKTYRNFDIEKARSVFSRVGREGEELVDKYFAAQLKAKVIQYYDWKNRDKESGLPYDFTVETLTGEVFYLDVKTTSYTFEQKMIFSSQEIEFVDNCEHKYFIYRVYNNDEQKYLRICHNAKNLFSPIHSKTTQFENDMQDMAGIESVKMAILPLHKLLEFSNEIAL